MMTQHQKEDIMPINHGQKRKKFASQCPINMEQRPRRNAVFEDEVNIPRKN